MDPVEGMIDEDGEMYSVAMQDMDASCLYSTANQWTEILADVDDEDEDDNEDFDLHCFKHCNGKKWPAVTRSGPNVSRTS
jgi:hypothetical protein